MDSTFDSWQFFVRFLEFGLPFAIVLAAQLFAYKRVGYRISNTIRLAALWIPKEKWKLWYIPTCIGLAFLCTASVLFLLLWGGMSASELRSPLAGLVVIFLGLSLLCMLFGFLQWKNSAFRMSIGAVIYIGASCSFYFVYQLCFVFLVEPFSFQAVSATFLTYNMLFIVALIYLNLMGDRKSADAMLSKQAGASSASGTNSSGLANVNLPKALKFMDSLVKIKGIISIVLYILSLLTLLCYALLVQYLADQEGRFIGWVSVGAVLVIDLIAVAMYRSKVLASPMFVMLLCAGARTAIVAFGIKWWFLSQSVIYFSFGCMLGQCIIDEYLPTKSEESELNSSIDGVLQQDSVLGPRRYDSWSKFKAVLQNHAFLLATFTLIYLIPLILVAADAVYAPTVLMVDGSHSQYVFGLASLFLMFFVVLVKAALRVWKIDAAIKVGTDGKPQMATFKQRFGRFISFCSLSYLFAIACGVFIYVPTKSVIVLSSCMCAPQIALALFLVARGWMSNDYDILQPVTMRPEVFPPSKLKNINWQPIRDFFANLCRKGTQVVPIQPDPSSTAASTVTAGGGSGSGDNSSLLPNGSSQKLDSPRATNAFLCFFRGGLTTRDYAMIAGISWTALVIMSWGLAIGLTFNTAPWLGWTIACALVSGICCAAGVVEWFATLELGYSIFVYFIISGSTWLAYAISMFVDVLGAKTNNNSLALLLAFLLWPVLVLLGTALFKWKDDKWKITNFVKINLSISLALVLAFIITVCIVGSIVAGIALLTAFIFLLTLIGTMAAWVINGRYLDPRHLRIAIGSLSLILAVSVIAAVSLQMFFVGFSLLTLSFAFALGVNWVRFLLTAVEGSVMFSDFVFPVYFYDPQKDAVSGAWRQVASGYGCMLLIILWSSLANIFLAQPVYGLGMSSLALLAIFVYTMDNQMKSAFLFGKLAAYIKPQMVETLRAKAFIAELGALLDDEAVPESEQVTDHQQSPSSLPVITLPPNAEDHTRKMKELKLKVREREIGMLKIGVLPEAIYDMCGELKTLEEQLLTCFNEQKKYEAHFKFLLFFAALMEKKAEDLEIADMLRAKGITGITQQIVSGWDSERKERLAQELAAWRILKAKEAEEIERKRKEAEEAHKRRLEEEKRKRDEEARLVREAEEHKKREAEEKARAEREEKERLEREEQERKRREEQEKAAREAEERRKLEEQIRLLQEEQARIDRERKEEQERRQREEAERERQRIEREKQEAERKRLEEERRKKEEEEKKRREEEMEKERQRLAEERRKLEEEQKKRLEEEQKRKEEREKKEREDAERRKHEQEEEAEKKKREMEKQEREKREREEEARRRKEEQDRLDKLHREQQEAEERRRKEEEARKEQERLRVEKEKRDAEQRERERIEREKREKEEKDRQELERQQREREQREREEKIRLEKEKLEKEKREREEKERKEREEAERQRKLKEEEERKAKEAAARLEEERKKKEQEANLATSSDTDDKVVATMKAKADEIITRCKAQGKPWEDPDFPLDKAPGSVADKIKEWKRPVEYMKGKPPVLFADSCASSDIRQGQLGDCWFLSAMSVVALHESRLKRLFITPEYNEQGVYCVRFYREGRWVPIIVDDRIPMSKWGGPSFGQSKQEGELWISILEKAYSKLHGTFGAIEAGFVNVALSDMTGGIGRYYMFSNAEVKADIASGKLWTMMVDLIAAGHMMGAGSPDGSDTNTSTEGIVQGHAYSITDIQEVDGNRLIRLRNPWGRTEWKGDWSDSSSLWTKRMKAKVNYQEIDDGEFWMCFEDFIRYFADLYVCKLYESDNGWKRQSARSEWKGKTAGGCFNYPDTAQHNPQFAITVTRPTKVLISLAQPEVRGTDRKYFATGWVLYDNQGLSVAPPPPRPHSLIGCAREKRRKIPLLCAARKTSIFASAVNFVHASDLLPTLSGARVVKNTVKSLKKSGFSYQREVVDEFTLDPLPHPYTLFCATFEPGQECPFGVTVISDYDVKIQELKE